MHYTYEVPDYRSRSLSGLFTDLWRDTTILIREEAALAKSELMEKGSLAVSGMAWLAVGGAVVLIGALFLLVAAVVGLAMLLPEEVGPWLAPLIAGIVIIPIGLALLAKARGQLASEKIKPTQSMRSVRKDVQALKEHVQ